MKRLTFALLLILLTALIACGTTQPAANSHPVNIVIKQIDPCSLVTKAQVEQILKTQVTVAQQPAIPNSNGMRYVSCSYFSSDFSAYADISLEIYKDVAGARTAFEDHKHKILIVSQFVEGTPPPSNIHVTRQNISGLGDQAFLIITPQFPMLYVQKGNAILSIIASNSGQPVSQFAKLEQQLGQLAVRNI